ADGNDTLVGGPGDDTLNGGDGNDTASYGSLAVGAVSGATVNLTLIGVQPVGGGLGSDTLNSIENLFGSPLNDTLTGDSNDNTLDGRDGDDTLGGGDGRDRLLGGNGDD